MCVVAAKYLKGIGWTGAKARDRNYACHIKIVTSNREDVQRLFIDDQTTRWTEGINEYGLCILSAAFSTKSDEKEGEKVQSKTKTPFKSPLGLAIRNALLLKDPKKAVDFLVDKELPGATLVFNAEKCYVLEAGYIDEEYVYNVKEISKEDGFVVRTNHGIDLPKLGYPKTGGSDDEKKSRRSSEERWRIVNAALKKDTCKRPEDVLDALSEKPNIDPFMNPIRTGSVKKGDMVTTGQILVCPAERTMHYRPIYSKVEFDYHKLNGEKTKTFFEIISSKKLLSFRKFRNK
jgi:hypothetical protein